MASELTIDALGRDDLPSVGVLFEAHTGRPADLGLLGSWMDEWPSTAARREGTLVGYAVCKGFAPDIAEVASLLVDPGARDAGIGSRLVSHVEEACRGRGARAMVAVTSDHYGVAGEKRSSRPMYERLGYRLVLETPATSVMARTLDQAG